MPAVGDRVPEFSVFREFKDPIASPELFEGGPTLVHFYVFDFSGSPKGGWELHLSRVRDRAAEFEEAGVRQIVGISTDSPFAHRAYAERLGLNFPLLSDYNYEAAEAFDVLRDELFGFRPLNTRAAFLVGRGGEVLHAWVADEPSNLPDDDELLAAARAANLSPRA
jgi:peroxiredoxin